MRATHQRRARLGIDVSPEARRRIQITAARRDQTIQDYVWEAVDARLKRDLGDEFSAVDPVAMNERADPVLANLWNNPRTPRMTSFSHGCDGWRGTRKRLKAEWRRGRSRKAAVGVVMEKAKRADRVRNSPDTRRKTVADLISENRE